MHLEFAVLSISILKQLNDMHLEFAVLSISILKQSFKFLRDKETDVATETATNKATSDSRG
jgi:hypothetical protein